MSLVLARFVVRARAAFLVGLTLVTIAAAFAAVRIEFDFTVQALFAGNDELVAYAEEFKRDFGYDDAVMLVVFKNEAAGDVLSAEALRWTSEVGRRLAALPSVRGVESVTTINIARFRLLGTPPIYAAPMIAPQETIDDAVATRVRATLARTRMIDGTLVSHDRKAGMIVAYLDPASRDLDSTRAATDAAKAILRDAPAPAGFTVGLSGLAPLRVDVVESLQKDQELLLPLAGVVFVGVLMLLFGRVRIAVASVITVAVGLCWTMAVVVLAGESLNIISNILPILLMIIGVSSVVHVALRYGEEYEKRPDRKDAAARTLAAMFVPCLLTYATTAIGFFSLAAARSTLLQALAWESALGLVFLYAATIFYLGPALPYVRPPLHTADSERGTLLLTRVALAAADFVNARPRLVVVAAFGVLAVSAGLATRVPVNSFVLETYDETHPTHRLISLMEENLSGLVPLDVSLTADRPGRFLESETYRKIAELEDFAAAQPGVLLARGYVDLVEEILAGSAGKAAPVRATSALLESILPRDDDGEPGETAVQVQEREDRRLRRAGQVLKLVGDEIGYRAFMRKDDRRARLLLRIGDVGTQRTLEIVAALEAKAAALFPPGSGIETRVTGDAYLNAKSLDGFIRDLFSSLLTAGLIIFGVIALLLRSWRYGLIAVPPNVLPLAAALGYLALRGYDLNVGNVIVLSISLGVVVDNTIHFLARFDEESAHAPGDARAAIRRTYAAAGRAMILTTLIVVVGLAVLVFSEFVPTRRFAELTIVTMIWALIGDLLVLPACLLVFGGAGASRGTPEPNAGREATPGLDGAVEKTERSRSPEPEVRPATPGSD